MWPSHVGCHVSKSYGIFVMWPSHVGCHVTSHVGYYVNFHLYYVQPIDRINLQEHIWYCYWKFRNMLILVSPVTWRLKLIKLQCWLAGVCLCVINEIMLVMAVTLALVVGLWVLMAWLDSLVWFVANECFKNVRVWQICCWILYGGWRVGVCAAIK